MHHDHDHSRTAIEQRLSTGPQLSYLRDWVYGGIDGAVTTFAVVSGVVGAELSHTTILILGISNILADGFSMAAGNYAGTKSEHDQKEHFKRTEERHIDTFPAGEREELRQILALKGLEGEVLEQATAQIAAKKDKWIDLMLYEEYGIGSAIRSPWSAATNTFVSFLLFGLLPLFPFLFGLPKPFLLASILTGVAFFSIGSLKSRWSLQSWWLSGLQTLAIGATAAIIAYLAGVLLGDLIR